MVAHSFEVRHEAYTAITSIYEHARVHGPKELKHFAHAILPMHEHSADEEAAQDFANFWGTIDRFGVVVVDADEFGGDEMGQDGAQVPLSGVEAVIAFAQTSGPIVFKRASEEARPDLSRSSSETITASSLSGAYPVTESQHSADIVGVVSAESAVEEESIVGATATAIAIKYIEVPIASSAKEVSAVVKSDDPVVVDIPAWLASLAPASFEHTAEPRPYADKTQINTIAFPSMDGDAESVVDLPLAYPDVEGWPNYFALKEHEERQQEQMRATEKGEEMRQVLVEERENQRMRKKHMKKNGVMKKAASFIRNKVVGAFTKRSASMP
jgi:hypothetical protein